MSNGPIDVVALARALVSSESVTPARGRVFDVLAAALAGQGFAIDRFVVGEAPDGPVENMLAVRGGGGPHFAFAGPLDVVPPGPGWTYGADAGVIADGRLYGRGAVDMKGAVAAFAAAAARVSRPGTTSLIITGDEEGPAIFGTRALIDRMGERGLAPDLCLIGEPTSSERLGDTIKIGRRGSVNLWIDVPGRQGHVAYPHLADNPITRLVAMLAELDGIVLDDGTEWFQPSTLAVTDLTVGNPAHNVIPGAAAARLSIRFNDRHDGAALAERVRTVARRHAPQATVTAKVSGEAFLTPPGALSTLVAGAIERTLGVTAALSTTGGTSDARFLSRLCPTVEFGLVNATMHQVDEAVAVADLRALTRVYAEILRNV